MLNLSVLKTDYFNKIVKNLSKRYRNIEYDIDYFIDNIESIEYLGTAIGKHIYKTRIKNSDNKKGKSGGYRIISYLRLVDKELTLIYIYSKSDYDNIDEKLIDKLVLDTLNT